MEREDRSWITTVLTVVILAAVAWLVGGGVRILLLTLGEGREFAGDVGALSAIALFILLVLGYFIYAYVPRATDEDERAF